MRISAQERVEGQMLPPRWYGLAYFDPVSNAEVFYPVPANYAARGLLLLGCLWDRVRSRRTRTDRRLAEGVAIAQRRGYYRGFSDGQRASVTRLGWRD